MFKKSPNTSSRGRRPLASVAPRAPRAPGVFALRAWNLRFVVAGFAVALAVLGALAALRPPSNGTPTLVLARSVQAGEQVLDTDLKVEAVPARLRPRDAYSDTDLDKLLGARAAVTLNPGTVLSPPLLLTDDWSTQLGPGQVALAIELPRSTDVALLRTGMRVQVWDSNADVDNRNPRREVSGSAVQLPQEAERIEGPQMVASSVLVLAVQESNDSLLSASQGSPIAFIATDQESARMIVAAQARGDLTFVISS
ncbi:MAG: SAF domain-containing protein [Actinomycetaceae bacterium]|nr:SAF domain-containing protein [Actinomycetaceae bacterium]